MKEFYITIEKHDGQRLLTVSGFVLSAELAAIKEKIGDINKLPLNKKIKVKID